MILQCDRCRKYYDGRHWVELGLFEPKTNESQFTLCPVCREHSQLERAGCMDHGREAACETEQTESRGMRG